MLPRSECSGEELVKTLRPSGTEKGQQCGAVRGILLLLNGEK